MYFSIVEISSEILVWVYDNKWIEDTHYFIERLGELNKAVCVLVVLFIYFIQFFFKNVVTNFFFAQVIDGSFESWRVQEIQGIPRMCIQPRPHPRTRSEMDDVWSYYSRLDENGNGVIGVPEYFRFILSLQEPLLLDFDGFLKKLNIKQLDFEGIHLT